MKVKCQECGLMVEKIEAIHYENKNYHKDCVEIKKERQALYKQICSIFYLKTPGPRMYTQIKNFLLEGYTYKGMMNALEYFYVIKKNSTDKSNGGLGIIPYVYKEAEEYYSRLNYKKEKIASGAKNFSDEKRVIILKDNNEAKKEVYDLNDI